MWLLIDSMAPFSTSVASKHQHSASCPFLYVLFVYCCCCCCCFPLAGKRKVNEWWRAREVGGAGRRKWHKQPNENDTALVLPSISQSVFLRSPSSYKYIYAAAAAAVILLNNCIPFGLVCFLLLSAKLFICIFISVWSCSNEYFTTNPWRDARVNQSMIQGGRMKKFIKMKPGGGSIHNLLINWRRPFSQLSASSSSGRFARTAGSFFFTLAASRYAGQSYYRWPKRASSETASQPNCYLQIEVEIIKQKIM